MRRSVITALKGLQVAERAIAERTGRKYATERRQSAGSEAREAAGEDMVRSYATRRICVIDINWELTKTLTNDNIHSNNTLENALIRDAFALVLAVLSLPHTPPPQPALSYFLHFQNSIGLRTVDTFLPHLRAALPGLVNAEPTFDRSHIPPRQDVLQRQKTLMQQSREVPTAESALNPPQPTVSSPGSVT